jgi:hypothetical protein
MKTAVTRIDKPKKRSAKKKRSANMRAKGTTIPRFRLRTDFLKWRVSDRNDYATVAIEGVAPDETDHEIRFELMRNHKEPRSFDVFIHGVGFPGPNVDIEGLTQGQLCALYRAFGRAAATAQREGWIVDPPATVPTALKSARAPT